MVFDRKSIVEKLKKLKTVVTANRSDKLCEGVLFEDGYITATNSSMSLRIPMGSLLSETLILPTEAIDLLGNFSSSEVEIIPSGKDGVLLKGGAAKVMMRTLPPDEYLKHNEPEDAVGGEVDWSDFREKISAVLTSCSRDTSSKPALTGVHLYSDEGQLHMVACDGYRMASDSMQFEGKMDCIVPRDTLAKLVTFVNGKKASLKVAPGWAVFKGEDFELAARLLDGAYPIRLNQIYPKYTNTAEINVDYLAGALKRVRGLCKTVALHVKDDQLQISCNSETAIYDETIPMESKLETEIRIAFNVAYCAEMLSTVKAATRVMLGFSNGSSIQPMIMEDKSYHCLVLPVKLAEKTSGKETEKNEADQGANETEPQETTEAAAA